jgi:ribosomal protein L27
MIYTCLKQVLWGGGGTSGRGRENQDDEGERIWWTHFAFVCENRTIKPGEIILRGRGVKADDGGNESN